MVADKKRALAEQHGEAFAKAELGTSGANPKNAKRQYSRLVRNFKLTLNIHVSEFTVSDGPRTVKIPFLKPSDVLTTLLQKYPWLLLGGCEIGAQSEDWSCRFGIPTERSILRMTFSNMIEPDSLGQFL